MYTRILLAAILAIGFAGCAHKCCKQPVRVANAPCCPPPIIANAPPPAPILPPAQPPVYDPNLR